MKLRRTTARVAGIALVISGTMLAVAPARAENALMSVQQRFKNLDTDHDGFVSRSEMQKAPGYSRAFEQADDNHDGRLDADEFVKAESIHERIAAANYVEDSVITAKVKAALLKQPQLDSLDVSVETYRGHVLLSGFVDDARQRAKAIQVASSVKGVVGVKDGLALR